VFLIFKLLRRRGACSPARTASAEAGIDLQINGIYAAIAIGGPITRNSDARGQAALAASGKLCAGSYINKSDNCAATVAVAAAYGNLGSGNGRDRPKK